MTSHQSEKPLYHCPECGLEKRRDYCLKCGTFGNTATNEIVESEKPPSCNVCRTKDAGMPVPGYIHDPGCTREKPPSGVEVLKKLRGRHVRQVCGAFCPQNCGWCTRCKGCSEPWPCPMFRTLEQIEELRAQLGIAVTLIEADGGILLEARQALTLSKLEAR